MCDSCALLGCEDTQMYFTVTQNMAYNSALIPCWSWYLSI